MNKLLNFFRRGNSVVGNPNTPIHNDLNYFFLMLVEEMKKYSSDDYEALQQKEDEISKEAKQVFNIIDTFDKDIKREKSNLVILGFNNAKSERLKQYEEEQMKFVSRLSTLNKERDRIMAKMDHQRNLRTSKEILQRLKKDFGEEALFVRYDDFEKVINKYNLVCGRLSDYKGVLPEYKMADINRVLTMDIPEFWKNKISKLYNAYEIRKGYEKHYKIGFNHKFPFYTKENFPEEAAWSSSGLFYKVPYYNHYRFFIAAPAHEMSTKKELWERAKKRAKDPFICAHTKWGIIIFTKWGEEAEDEIIKKYE